MTQNEYDRLVGIYTQIIGDDADMLFRDAPEEYLSRVFKLELFLRDYKLWHDEKSKIAKPTNDESAENVRSKLGSIVALYETKSRDMSNEIEDTMVNPKVIAVTHDIGRKLNSWHFKSYAPWIISAVAPILSVVIVGFIVLSSDILRERYPVKDIIKNGEYNETNP